MCLREIYPLVAKLGSAEGTSKKMREIRNGSERSSNMESKNQAIVRSYQRSYNDTNAFG